MASNNSELDKRLWTAADQLRANSRLKATEYSVPVLGLIFLRYADVRVLKKPELRVFFLVSLMFPRLTDLQTRILEFLV